jgi:hypothetical protein
MRLTLRTLLAYLDGNLEADDAKDIAKKVEESEFATKLVHLIRDCTRRLRLGAPPLMGRGLGGDPNTVAEYLEYRLSDDRVPEFEKICLDSEIELAEVASCHQILTLVLGEPAEIPGQMRERLYALAAQADAPPQQPPAAPAPQPVAAAPVVPPAPPVVRRPRPEVPEYLRETRWRWWPVAALVLLAATLTFAGLVLFGPAELRDRVTALVAAPEESAPAADADHPPGKPAVPQAVPAKNAKDSASPPPSDAAKQAEKPVVAPPKSSSEDPAAPLAPEPSEPKTAQPAAENTARPSEAAEPKPAENPKPAADSPPADTPGHPPANTAPDAKPPATPAPPPQADAARDPPEGFGRYTSQSEVLLKLDPATDNWLRVPANSPLNKGDQLLSLPLFQPTITLSSNVTVQADGAARFELLGWTDRHVPIMKVEFGRLLMATVGRADNSLQLQTDSQQPLLTFVDAESTLALEVNRDLPPGKDPESGPAPLVANVYATSGLIRVGYGTGDAVELRAPAQRSLVAAAEQPPAADFPAWVTAEPPSGADRRAAGDLDGYLATGKPVALQLRELTSPDGGLGRKREVRSLAIRSLAYLGDFEPCVAVLNVENERFIWPLAVDELRAAIARDPHTAKRVREAFESKRGVEDGTALFRMLWGYSVADLKAGADRELVEALASESVDFRVLSSLVLQNLTGKTHGYRPEDREVNRRTAYNTWKKEIGRITPRAPQPPAKSRPPKAE